jgi:hypothetical protein
VADLVPDHDRETRTGVPELVYGATKTADQIIAALVELARGGRGALATLVSEDKARVITAAIPDAIVHVRARCVELPRREDAPPLPSAATIAVVCAGTSDLPVADEATVVAGFLGAPTLRISDVGVAGLHRLLSRVEDIKRASVIIAVAGMEAALPSVLGGLVDIPMIAVPTSVGYGVSVDGLVAMGGLLAACAPGITVVNIDNGVGAAVAAVRIARLAARGGAW